MKRAIITFLVLVLLPATLYATSSLPLDVFVQIADRDKPGVVNISTTRFLSSGEAFVHPPVPQRRPFRDPSQPFRRPRQPGSKQRSLGSGFVVDPNGLILTNDHVVANTDEIVVRLNDGREYLAEVLGSDSNTDLALLKIGLEEGDKLKTLELGDSDVLKVGEWVMAIGSPYGLDHTVTVGVVSAKGRALGASPYENYIQTDASINPGNSGGPLLNVKGQVVGISTAMISSAQGIGFAIPVNQAKRVLANLRSTGKVIRGWLGLTPQGITAEMAEALGLDNSEGIIVANVLENEPAHRGGLRAGDVIVSLNGKKISELRDLFRFVAEAPVGKEAQVEIIRQGKNETLKVAIGQRPDREVAARPDRKNQDELGLKVTEVPGDDKSGVMVEEVPPGSLADRADLAKGDVILEVNYEKINDVDRFNKLLDKNKGSRPVLLYIKREQRFFFSALRIP
jgi:serine protease Do